MARVTDLLVLAVTRISDGVCVACVDEGGKWIRPTRESGRWRQLSIEDLKDARGRIVVRVGNIVRWPLGRAIPRDTHTEDVLADFGPPALVRTVSPAELLKKCEELRQECISCFRRDKNRSLMLLQPHVVHQIAFSSGGADGVEAKIDFSDGGAGDRLKVTDVGWRAMGRRLLAQNDVGWLQWNERQLRDKTGLKIKYVAIGKAQREWQGSLWDFVIGVFCDPLHAEPIDYARL